MRQINNEARRVVGTSMNFDNKTNLIVKGTPGTGDAMYALNIAYNRSFVYQQKIILTFKWFHSRGFNFHMEDPETIIEKIHYLQHFYDKEFTNVKIEHEFNCDDMLLWAKRHIGFERKMRYGNIHTIRHNDWWFADWCRKEVIPKKIVLWNQTGNANLPRGYKRPFDREDWNIAKELMDMQGWDVTEIDYRTPIREAFWHINTCECTVSYEGMWHYVAKNFQKPMIVLTKDIITRHHTPNAMIYQVPKVKEHHTEYFHRFDKKIQRAKDYNLVEINKRKALYIES